MNEIDVPIYLITVSLAVWQHVTVTKGQTVDLSCPIINAHQSVEWKNPEGYIMFFKHNQGKDELSWHSNANDLMFGPYLHKYLTFEQGY